MPEGQMFLDFVLGRLSNFKTRLEREKDPIDLYRSQGEISALRTITDLPLELKQVLADKTAGKLK